MSEIVNKAQRFASMSLQVTATGKEVVRKRAMCPTHQRLTSDYVGATDEGWLFRCREKGGHDYLALHDPRAPKTQAQVEAWFIKQRQERMRVANG